MDTIHGTFYGNKIKLYTNTWGTEMIAYVVTDCDEKMRDWLVGYFQEQHHENEAHTLKFLDCQTNPGGECIFCFDKPHATPLRNFIETRGPMPLAEVNVVIGALIRALTNGRERPYQCLTPDTVFYDAAENRMLILPVCPAGGNYEFSCTPMEIAPEAWKSESWLGDYSEVPANWTADVAAADVFSIGLLYMELVAGSTDWPHLNEMLSGRSDIPEPIIRCCCSLPSLRPYLSELLAPKTAGKPSAKRVSPVHAASRQSDFVGQLKQGLKQKFSSVRDIFDDDDDDFSSRPNDGGDAETR